MEITVLKETRHYSIYAQELKTNEKHPIPPNVPNKFEDIVSLLFLLLLHGFW